MQQPRNRQPVASVVAFAAQDHDALAVDRIELAHHLFHHAMGRVLHQCDARNAVFDGEAVHLAHLLGGQHFHARHRQSREKLLEPLQVARIPHRDQMISGRHLRLGRGIEEHLAVGFANGQNDHAALVADVDVRQCSPGKRRSGHAEPVRSPYPRPAAW